MTCGCIKIPVFPGCSWFDQIICTPIEAQQKLCVCNRTTTRKTGQINTRKAFCMCFLVLCDGVCEFLWPPYILRVRIRTKLHQDFGHVNIFPSAADVKRHVSVCLETQFNHHKTNQMHSSWNVKLGHIASKQANLILNLMLRVSDT